MLGKKDYGLQLFLPSRVQIACNFTHNKGAEKKQQIRNVKQKKQKSIKRKHYRRWEKSTQRCSICITNSTTKRNVKEKELAAKKKTDRKAKKVQVTIKTLASQVNKNLLIGIQKSCMYNRFFK